MYAITKGIDLALWFTPGSNVCINIFMLRTEEQKQKILSRLEPTKVYQNVVPDDLMSELLEAWESGPKNHKNTGPVTYDYYPNKEEHTDWWIKTDKFITEFIGDRLFATNFLK